MNKIKFNKKKIAAQTKIAGRLISNTKFTIGRQCQDFERDLATLMVQSYVWENIADERTLEYYCNPPSFFDWLFRRSKKVTFNLKVKDLLLDAKKTTNTVRTIHVGLDD